MLKYVVSLSVLVLFAASCKKESVGTVTPPPPGSTTAQFSLLNASGSCNEIKVEGSYTTGVALTSANKVLVQVKVTTAGSYSITLTSTNGYQFAAAGTFATGDQQLVLTGSGTPTNQEINNFSIPTGSSGSGCGFSIRVISVTPLPAVLEDNDNMYFGNPGNAGARIDSANNYLMRKQYYSLSYNSQKGIPNWVCWHLTKADLGGTERQEDFIEDFSLPTGWYQVTKAAYNAAGFNRGHNIPSGDRTSTTTANSSTFLMTNIIPQAPYHNQVVWATMEDSLRRLASLGYEVYIMMGNYGAGGTGDNGYATSIDAGRITVPANIWKVAVVLQNGDNDSSRVNVNTRIIAVDIPNTNALTANWKNYRVSVDAIETATGYDLLSRLPATLQASLEAKIDKQ
ncbi:MAG: DNA/RNA non-specific endonuclease [Ferruginibacter sp.]